MDTAQVAAYLQQQFTGQLVLYVADMAKILGKSEKAIAGLIARDGLPFKVKLLGGLRCVDIFQVAQWLAETAGAAEEVTEAPSAVQPKPNAESTKKRNEAQSVQLSMPTSLPSVAQQLLEMRHDYSGDLKRLALGCQKNERVFLLEVADELQAIRPRYRVSISGCDVSTEVGPSLVIFEHDSLQAAEDFLLSLLSDANHHPTEFTLTFTLFDEHHVMYLCNVRNSKFNIEVDEIKLELLGL